MKRFAVAATVLALAACSGKDDAKKDAATDANAKPAIEFKSDADKALYVVASRYGSELRHNLEQFKQMEVTVDNEMVIKGFADGLNDKAAVNEQDGQAVVQKFAESLQQKQQALQAKQQEENVKKSAENKVKGEAFLAELDKKGEHKKTASGLRYKVVTEGDGKAKPKAEDTVVVHYKGTLIDGTPFDSSYERNQPAEFPVNGVIAGWTEALQLMSKGAKYQLAIPADIAYGDRATGKILPGSTLLFEVELLDVKKAAK